MKELIPLLTYIFETLKFVIISYHIIGLKSAENKKRYIIFPIWLVLGMATYVTGDFTILNNIILIISLIFLWFNENLRLSVLSIIMEWFTVSFIDLMMWLVLVSGK